MLEHYFGAHGWAFERTGDDEIVANVQGSWASYELRAVWRVEDRVLQFLALPDIRVPSDKRIAIYETIGLINEQLWLGHFEMWRSEEHTSELQSLMRISYAVFCLQKKNKKNKRYIITLE